MKKAILGSKVGSSGSTNFHVSDSFCLICFYQNSCLYFSFLFYSNGFLFASHAFIEVRRTSAF